MFGLVLVVFQNNHSLWFGMVLGSVSLKNLGFELAWVCFVFVVSARNWIIGYWVTKVNYSTTLWEQFIHNYYIRMKFNILFCTLLVGCNSCGQPIRQFCFENAVCLQMLGKPIERH